MSANKQFPCHPGAVNSIPEDQMEEFSDDSQDFDLPKVMDKMKSLEVKSWPNELVSRHKSTQVCKTRTCVRTCDGWPNGFASRKKP